MIDNFRLYYFGDTKRAFEYIGNNKIEYSKKDKNTIFYLENLKVTIKPNGIKIENSLNKYISSNNFTNVTLNIDILYLIDILENLGIDRSKAEFSKLELGLVIQLNEAPASYLKNFGDLSNFNKNTYNGNITFYQPHQKTTIKGGIKFDKIYYKRALLLYDKNKEIEESNTIPKELKSELLEALQPNTLRIEYRLLPKHLQYISKHHTSKKALNIINLLHKVLSDFIDLYKSINRISNNTKIDYTKATSGATAYKALSAYAISQLKDPNEIIKQFNIKPQERTNLKNQIKKHTNENLIPTNTITEIDTKVLEYLNKEFLLITNLKQSQQSQQKQQEKQIKQATPANPVITTNPISNIRNIFF